MLIVLDNCDGYMEAEATQFQQFILDLTQKIQECSVLITARDYNGTDTDIKFSKLQVPKLNPQGVVSLLSNTKKDEEKVYGELADLYSHTVIQVSNDGKTWQNKSILHKHELFNKLNGNPLSVLLVSSLIFDSTLTEAYTKLETISSNEGLQENGKQGSLSYKLITHMNLDYIKSKDADLINGLKCLALCPGGLKLKELCKVSKNWSKFEVLLENKSIIVRHAGEKNYKGEEIHKGVTMGEAAFKNNLHQIPLKHRKSVKIPIKSHDSSAPFTDKVTSEDFFVIDKFVAQVIYEKMTPEELIKYDKLVVEYMVKVLRDMNNCYETEILIRYEENIWAALERLSERSMKSGAQLSYLGTFISKNSNVKGENKLEVDNNNVPGSLLSPIKNPTELLEKSNFMNIFQKKLMANQSAVLQKCFTGQFTKDSKNTQKDNTKNYSKIDSETSGKSSTYLKNMQTTKFNKSEDAILETDNEDKTSNTGSNKFLKTSSMSPKKMSTNLGMVREENIKRKGVSKLFNCKSDSNSF